MTILLFLISQIISSIGSVVFLVGAIGILAKANQPIGISLIQISLLLPAILFAKRIGKIVDRSNQHDLLIKVDFLGAIFMFLFGLIISLISGHYALWVAVVGAIVGATIDTIYMTASSAHFARNLKTPQLHKLMTAKGIFQAVVVIFIPFIFAYYETSLNFSILAILNSISYLISGILVLFLKWKSLPKSEPLSQLDVFVSESKKPNLILSQEILLPTILAGMILALIVLFVPFLGGQVFHSSKGIFYGQSLFAVGSVLGGLILIKLFKKFRIKSFNLYFLIVFITFLYLFLLKANFLAPIIFILWGLVVLSLDNTITLLIQENGNQGELGNLIAKYTAYSKCSFMISIILLSWIQSNIGFHKMFLPATIISGIVFFTFTFREKITINYRLVQPSTNFLARLKIFFG